MVNIAEISETTLGFSVFYIVFLLFVLFIISLSDVTVLKGITAEDIQDLQNPNALTLVTKFWILLSLSSDFQIVSGFLLICSIIMGYILVKEGKDLLQL